MMFTGEWGTSPVRLAEELEPGTQECPLEERSRVTAVQVWFGVTELHA